MWNHTRQDYIYTHKENKHAKMSQLRTTLSILLLVLAAANLGSSDEFNFEPNLPSNELADPSESGAATASLPAAAGSTGSDPDAAAAAPSSEDSPDASGATSGGGTPAEGALIAGSDGTDHASDTPVLKGTEYRGPWDPIGWLLTWWQSKFGSAKLLLKFVGGEPDELSDFAGRLPTVIIAYFILHLYTTAV